MSRRNRAYQQLASVEMVADKMHIKGHTDKCCNKYCYPAKFIALSNVLCFIYICIFWCTFTMDDCYVTLGRYRSV